MEFLVALYVVFMALKTLLNLTGPSTPKQVEDIVIALFLFNSIYILPQVLFILGVEPI